MDRFAHIIAVKIKEHIICFKCLLKSVKFGVNWGAFPVF